ncbi:hypothetical protein DIX60_08745 [Streptococcus iniae]|uniref:hypothetical protein n=1 Tax=Streptococcus iniae TaxID=1346 RepID=UPI0008DA8FBB|nr:hypothetical protein [Streptococcus iniae]OHX28285.1 hypothetical protein BKX95_00045 [Streptococcus iniae]RLV27098.1 hypothetical protein DIX60_08745 [Streptococcus iniae]
MKIKKIIPLLLFVAFALVISACGNDKSKTTIAKNTTASKQNKLTQKVVRLTEAEVKGIKAKPSQESQTIIIPYSSALSEGMVEKTDGTGQVPPFQKDYELKIPSHFEEMKSQNSNTVYTFPGNKVLVDIWSQANITKGTSNDIMDSEWLEAKDILENYISSQTSDTPKIFTKQIGTNTFSVSVNHASDYHQNLVTYSIINDQGNFSSSAIIVNVILFEKLPKEEQIDKISQVEGFLSQLDIKK